MKQSVRLNVALLIAVLLAGGLVYVRPPADAPLEYAVSEHTAAAATSIRIERPGREKMVVENRNGTWFLSAPFKARADEFMLQRILAILQARTSHRFPATDLARFKLEKPIARLTIDGQTFDFGMVSELSRDQYVRSGDSVYSLSARYGLALPTRPEALASRRLLAPGETPVRLSLPGFTVAQSGKTWIKEPTASEGSQDDIRRWVDGWLAATALRVEPYQEDNAPESVRIELASGEILRIGILSRKPEVALIRPDQHLQYSFAGEVGARLLAPPSAQKNPIDKH